MFAEETLSPPYMQIARIDQSWRLVIADRIHPTSLEELARRSGFRVIELCRILDVSEQHFRRIFHKDVGIPIKQWMKQERMMIARRMLYCDLSADEITETLGFSHPNSFGREFKQIYQMTVTDFLYTRQRRHEDWLAQSRGSTREAN